MAENISFFNEAFDFIYENEVPKNSKNGGYTNDTNDSGGQTKHGISAKSHPGIDIKNLTKDGAKIIYKKEYWKPEYDKLINKNLAIRVFDMTVNSGAENAGITLQKAINECGGTVETVKVDGDIGPITIKAANMCHNRWLLERFRVERSKYYADCVQRRPSDLDYLKGWIWRNYK